MARKSKKRRPRAKRVRIRVNPAARALADPRFRPRRTRARKAYQRARVRAALRRQLSDGDN